MSDSSMSVWEKEVLCWGCWDPAQQWLGTIRAAIEMRSDEHESLPCGTSSRCDHSRTAEAPVSVRLVFVEDDLARAVKSYDMGIVSISIGPILTGQGGELKGLFGEVELDKGLQKIELVRQLDCGAICLVLLDQELPNSSQVELTRACLEAGAHLVAASRLAFFRLLPTLLQRGRRTKSDPESITSSVYSDLLRTGLFES